MFLKGLLHQILNLLTYFSSFLAVLVVLIFAAFLCAGLTLALLLKWDRSSRRAREDV